MEYQEEGIRVKVSIWDQTGQIDIIFFNKNEQESHIGLSNFNYNEY